MNKENRFTKILENKKNIFVPFFTLGDPDFNKSYKLICQAIESGADALELGFPFSDPIADGETNQRSMTRALNSNMGFDNCILLLKKIREKYQDIPIGLLIYYNLIFSKGERFYKTLQDIGVDAVVSCDLPLEESDFHIKMMKKYNIGIVQMIAPNTSDKRAKILFEQSTAWTYVLSGFGTTGVKKDISLQTLERIKHLRNLTDKKMIVGFGISKVEHIKKVWESKSDGAIVGSYFSSIIEENLNNFDNAIVKICNFIKEANKL